MSWTVFTQKSSRPGWGSGWRCALLVLIVGMGAHQVLAQSDDESLVLEQQMLSASDAADFDHFYNVSVNGNIALIGASFDDCAAGDEDCGAVYVFRSHECEVGVPMSGIPDHEDGIFLCGNGVLDPGEECDDDNNVSGDGCQRDCTVPCNINGYWWVEEQKLTASDAKPGDRFGGSFSVSGNTAVIGALHADCETGNNCGAAYVFRYNGSSWVEEQKLTASDASAFDFFGVNVSVSGDTIVVGASASDCADGIACGSVYVFRHNGTSWVEEQKLTDPEARHRDRFGWSVSLSGDTIFVGSSQDDCATGSDCGSVFVYHFDGISWVEEQKLSAFDTTVGDRFGNSLGVSADILVVSAYYKDCSAGSQCGTVYVFKFDGTSWIEMQKLTSITPELNGFFGNSVSISGNTIVVGDPASDNAESDSGSAYRFLFNGISWVLDEKLIASDGLSGDRFGLSVSVSGDTTFVGAIRRGCLQCSKIGAVYVFPATTTATIIPAASTWSLVALCLSLLAAGTLILRRSNSLSVAR